jgi:hypothetical protein
MKEAAMTDWRAAGEAIFGGFGPFPNSPAGSLQSGFFGDFIPCRGAVVRGQAIVRARFFEWSWTDRKKFPVRQRNSFRINRDRRRPGTGA